MPATSQFMALGVIAERREIDNPWQRYRWQAVGVILGAGVGRRLHAGRALRRIRQFG